MDNIGVKKSKTKNLVLTVVNGVAKWVDASEATDRFIGLRQEQLTSRYFTRKTQGEQLSGELE